MILTLLDVCVLCGCNRIRGRQVKEQVVDVAEVVAEVVAMAVAVAEDLVVEAVVEVVGIATEEGEAAMEAVDPAEVVEVVEEDEDKEGKGVVLVVVVSKRFVVTKTSCLCRYHCYSSAHYWQSVESLDYLSA